MEKKILKKKKKIRQSENTQVISYNWATDLMWQIWGIFLFFLKTPLASLTYVWLLITLEPTDTRHIQVMDKNTPILLLFMIFSSML